MTLTTQELFNAAYLGVINQGGCAVDQTTRCLYRTENGRKCAFGHLIPDDVYTPLMEGKCSTGVMFTFDGFEHLKPYQALISRMQGAHDLAASTYDVDTMLKMVRPDAEALDLFRKLMADVAHRYNLEVPAC